MEEEKEKNNYLFSSQIKFQDNIIRNKFQTIKEEYYTLNHDQPYKFDNIYKNKEFNKFKEDILSYIHERDNYYLEKIKNIQEQTDLSNRNIDKLSESMQTNINNVLSKHVDNKSILEKLKTYDAFVNKANDKLISHEIRINCIKEDLTKSNQKYDKIYLDNLEVPGYIGRSSKYANCKIFFTEIIKELEKFNLFKQKNIIDLSTYKERLENLIKTFQSLVNNNNDSQIKYITKLNNKTNRNIIEIMEEKIKFLRMENAKFSLDLIKKTDELNSLYENINLMKENILQEFKTKSDDYNKKIEETNKSFNEFKIEYEIIRKKFLELADFIKNGKYTRSLGGALSRREINLISKKLNKEIKDKIEPKNVKIMRNINEVENLDFKGRNTIEYNSHNIYSYDFNRLSKSQNNFNHNNAFGKKKIFGLGNTIGNYRHKTRYSIDYQKKGFKINQGLLVYNKDNNLNDNNISGKILMNKNLYLKNDNKINENSKSQKITKIGKDNNNKNNIINNLEKEKNNDNNNIINNEKEKNNNNNNIINNLEKEKNNNNNNIINNLEKEQNNDNNNIINNLEKEKNNENKIKDNKNIVEIQEKKIVKLNNKDMEKKKERDVEKEKNKNKRNIINDDLSISESYISNINNSINTFSTANDNNNSFNAININNNNKVGKFNLFESNLDQNDKIIKELASELEQSTVKINKFGSNRKEIEKNFKSVCNKIQPVNLKLNKIELEKIEEVGDKNLLTNKSDQNTTFLSHNLNNINNNTDNSNNGLIRNNKLKELVELSELEENENKNNDIQTNESRDKNKNNENISNDNNLVKYNQIDKRMNIYDKKLGDLESFTKEQILEMIKQIEYLQKNYTHIINIIKMENKNFNNVRLNGFNSTKNRNNTSYLVRNNNNNNNNNVVNNENRNILNLSSNYFYKKSSSIDYNPRLLSNSKKTRDEIDLSDNLYYNGKYYYNIKDIFDKKKDKSIIDNYQYENKRLLKVIENKALEDNLNKTNNKIIKTNSSFDGNLNKKWLNLNKLPSSIKRFNKTLKP